MTKQRSLFDFVIMRLIHRIQKSGKELKVCIEGIFRISKDIHDKVLTFDQFVN